ncbi:MAG: hypothetical protein PUA69_07825 [Erysipelotrichaceae bacterium]|nr:hypothetical protein [Erysipelotrichaceae bacterium]
MTAEEMAEIKRGHWVIENSLHHVLDAFSDDSDLLARYIFEGIPEFD